MHATNDHHHRTTPINSRIWVRAMVYTNGSLWAVTRFNRLLVRDPVAGAPWNDVGHANDVKALTAIGDWLYAITGDNQLWTRQNLRTRSTGRP